MFFLYNIVDLADAKQGRVANTGLDAAVESGVLRAATPVSVRVPREAGRRPRARLLEAEPRRGLRDLSDHPNRSRRRGRRLRRHRQRRAVARLHPVALAAPRVETAAAPSSGTAASGWKQTGGGEVRAEPVPAGVPSERGEARDEDPHLGERGAQRPHSRTGGSDFWIPYTAIHVASREMRV